MSHLTNDWWRCRRSFTPADDDSPRLAVAGLYARYVPEAGVDYLFEFANDEGPVTGLSIAGVSTRQGALA